MPSRLLMIMHALVSCRPVIDQNFYYAGLKFTSPTFSCAMSNMLPAMTFIMAVLFRYICIFTPGRARSSTNT